MNFIHGFWREPGAWPAILKGFSDVVLESHALTCGGGFHFAKQGIWEFDSGSHKSIFPFFHAFASSNLKNRNRDQRGRVRVSGASRRMKRASGVIRPPCHQRVYGRVSRARVTTALRRFQHDAAAVEVRRLADASQPQAGALAPGGMVPSE